MAMIPGEHHFRTMLTAIKDGRLVPFLGAGVNLCGRPDGIAWCQGMYLPNGGELSVHLADHFNYPTAAATDCCPSCNSELRSAGVQEKQDLVRIAQYVALDVGSGPLYEELRNVFDADYPSTPLHEFLASLPSHLRLRKLPKSSNPLRRRLVILTTNYDFVLERAFEEAHESFHVVSYMADRALQEERGKCIHWPSQPGSKAVLIQSPNDYPGLLDDYDPVIVKIHGAVDRTNAGYDSFVVTEDHYIDYLTRADIDNVLPAPLPAILKHSHFLFLGYSLRDLNLRVILRLISLERNLTYNSWAVQLKPQQLDQKFWAQRNVEILDMPLENYVAALKTGLEAEPVPGGAA